MGAPYFVLFLYFCKASNCIINLYPYKEKALIFLNMEYYSLTRGLLMGDHFY